MSRWWWVSIAALAGCHWLTPSRPLEPPRPGPRPTIEVEAPEGYVGFGSEVRIAARVTGCEGQEVRLRWTQVAGPPVRLEGADTAELTFRTPTLDELVPPQDGPIRFLTLDRRSAGHFRFRVTVTAGDRSASAQVLVRAGAIHPGWPRASQGVGTVLEAGVTQDRYDWEVSFAPPRMEPELVGADTRRPVVRLAKSGRYAVREKVSGRELAFHGGPWMGTEQCGRVECHPLETRGWSRTKMATVLERGLDGRLRGDYGPECLRCHTVGWDPAVDNDGFDDVARAEGWRFPDHLEPGNFASLPHGLIDRSGVGCESCHGPGRFYTSYSAEVCAQCHDDPPEYIHITEWRTAPMARIRDGVVGREECERCHTAQGLLDEYYAHRPVEATAREDDVQYDAEPITCAACHDPHDGNQPRIVRYSGPLFGQEPEVDWGTGMICLACHHGGAQWASSRGALVRPFVARFREMPEPREVTLWDRRFAPHAPQAEMVRGRAGHALPGPGPLEASPPHLTVPGGCLGCHVRVRPPEGDLRRLAVGGHTFAMFRGEGAGRVENTLACAGCHGELPSLNRQARNDYDGDGRIEGIYDEVDGLLVQARSAIDGAIQRAELTDGRLAAVTFAERDGRIVLAAENGDALRDGEHFMTFPESEERLYRATYNYLVVVKDRSRGVHNPVATVRLLQRTVLRLAPRDVPRWVWR